MNDKDSKFLESLINTKLKKIITIKKENKSTKFMIIGDKIDTQKQYYNRICELISDLKLENEIILTGKRDDITQLLSILSIFVMSSVAEGTPMAILEAMAMEKPIITTDVGAISEQIENNVNGILVSSKNPEDLAKSVNYLLNNQDKSRELGNNARIKVKKLFSISSYVKKHVSLYNKILKS